MPQKISARPRCLSLILLRRKFCYFSFYGAYYHLRKRQSSTTNVKCLYLRDLFFPFLLFFFFFQIFTDFNRECKIILKQMASTFDHGEDRVCRTWELFVFYLRLRGFLLRSLIAACTVPDKDQYRLLLRAHEFLTTNSAIYIPFLLKEFQKFVIYRFVTIIQLYLYKSYC